MAAKKRNVKEIKKGPTWLNALAEDVMSLMEVVDEDEAGLGRQESFVWLDPKEVKNKNPYDQLAYHTKRFFLKGAEDGSDGGFTKFEQFITLHILLVGVTVGVDVSYDNPSPGLQTFLNVVNLESLVVFTWEACVKIISEGTQPWRYFTNSDGGFNTFDFFVVIMSLAFLGSSNGSMIAGLRLLRLLRLISLLQQSEDLRVIISGLIGGLKNVFYILLLLLLVSRLLKLLLLRLRREQLLLRRLRVLLLLLAQLAGGRRRCGGLRGRGLALRGPGLSLRLRFSLRP